MLKANWSITDLQKHFREILTKIDLIIGGNDKSGFVPLAKELTLVLPEISKEKTTLLLIKTVGEWLKDHPESGLVLLILNTAMESMTASLPYLGLKLLNKCIAAYFNRKISCDWHELVSWISIPERSKEWLYTTPSADAGIKPRFLVLNAHLINEMTELNSASSETALLKRLQEYLSSVKPKYIKPKKEAAFLLCVEKLQRMVIRQYSNGMATAVANEHLENYITFLKKLHSDEKGVSFFSMVTKFGRKPSYPIKIQLFSQIITLYISQQQTAPGQPPRLQASQGVLNSRLGAFKDLQKNKEYVEYNSVIQNAQPYFSQVEHYNLNHAGNLFAKTAHILYPSDKTLLRLDA
uniref:Uncharacterized protein n=1 Tax=Panagrolaimus superbus TaxID=310955 RepID=A0A914YDY6_9BILA